MSEEYLPHDWFPRPLPFNVRLGEGTWLYSTFAFLHYESEQPCGLQVGHDSGLYHGTFFDLGPDAEVQIGDFCSIVGAIIMTNGRVSVGNYCFISHEVVIAAEDFAIPGEVVGTRRADEAFLGNRNTVIEENVWVGAQATIIGDVRIGEGSIVGAASVVRENVPPYSIYAGNPGRVVGKIARPNTRE